MASHSLLGDSDKYTILLACAIVRRLEACYNKNIKQYGDETKAFIFLVAKGKVGFFLFLSPG
jgi:hypothetical protein